MIESVQKSVREWNMIDAGDRVLAAVSGGADSVALLLILRELQGTMDFALEVLHVEHGIRGEESREDSRFVERLCQQLEIPYQVVAVDAVAYAADHGLGLEEAARILRYEAFKKRAQETGAKVALAHHMEDNAETVLLQMLRGSGITGLCGMKPVRRDDKGVVYLRPLLEVHRGDLEQYLLDRQQEWKEDSTNTDTEYRRNYMRHEVMPRLTQINTQAVEHINASAEHLAEICRWMEQEVDKVWDMVAQVEEIEGSICCKLDVAELGKHPVALQGEILMKALSLVAGRRKDLGGAHIRDLRGLLEKQSGREVHLPYGVVARREFRTLVLGVQQFSIGDGKIRIDKEKLEDCRRNKEMLRIPLGDTGECLQCRIFKNPRTVAEIPKKTYTKWLDYDKIEQGFCIRNRQNGDYFISDTMGHRKKLQNYFVDEKIPVSKREQMWLLAEDSQVLWLIGGRISENLKVTEHTNTIIAIEYIGGK